MSPSPTLAVLEALDGNGVTTAQIAEATGLDRKAVVRGCDALRRHDWAERIGQRGVYRITAAGIAARKAGTRLKSGPPGPHTGRRNPPADTLRSRLWSALRHKRRATVGELLVLSAGGDERAPESNAYRYLGALVRCGYAVQLKARRRTPGVGGDGEVVWALVRDTGPQAPYWSGRRRAVFDPNLREHVAPIEEKRA